MGPEIGPSCDGSIVDFMTWIVGASTMFGYGFGISDVCVALGDDDKVDCLQKVYPIGRHFAAGFAGLVAIGFAMLDELRRLSTYADERIACDPRAAFREWPACARAVFSDSKVLSRRVGAIDPSCLWISISGSNV
jgi:hypothetical protein